MTDQVHASGLYVLVEQLNVAIRDARITGLDVNLSITDCVEYKVMNGKTYLIGGGLAVKIARPIGP